MMNPPVLPQASGFSFHVPPPHAVEQPPQIFGGFSADGTSLPPALPGPIFGDDPSLLLGEEGLDHNDPKRRRIARACDMCRKKKIKCDGKQPACSHCQNYKTDCVFTQVEKKRNPPKGAKYIEGLENRLGRMESLLRLSGLLSQDDDGKTDLGTLETRLVDKFGSGTEALSKHSERATSVSVREESASAQSTPHQLNAASPESTTSPEPASEKKSEEEVEALSDMMCSLVTNNCGETKYIGSSSGFSIFSPKGIQWVNEKTGDSSFQDMISGAALHDSKWQNWKPDVFGDIFTRRVYMELPPKHEALSLLKDFFENFNCMSPLFHEPTFMHLVDRQYSQNPYESSGWWASLNVALAIAHRLRVMSNLVPQEEDEKGWAYLKNALAVQSELTIKNTDLLSVQALLGMALFLLGTPNPQPSFFLVAAAIRLAHSIGLHKRGSGFNLNPVENEQRKRVFWIAYMLDKDHCIRSGRPPIQDDDDMNVDLPSEDPSDNIGNIPLADGKSKINLFRLICHFATIESKVYKQLYSVKASKQSDGELLNTIGKLDKELEDWKNGIPLDFRPEHEIKASHTPLMLHVVVLHFSYYNCLMTIHRMSIHHGYWTSRLSNYAIKGLNARPLNPRVFSSAVLCVQAARASIHLIKYIPQGDFACVWMIIYFPVSALVTIFANILQNPNDSRAREDLKLMNVVVKFLSMLCQDGENGSVMRMLSVCSEFERVAKLVLEKSDKDAAGRRKRKVNEDKNRPQSISAANPASLLSPDAHSNRRSSTSSSTITSSTVSNAQALDFNAMTPSTTNISAYSPATTSSATHTRNNSAQPSWMSEYSSPLNSSKFTDTSSYATPSNTAVNNHLNVGNIPSDSIFADSFNPKNTFQQPFVPQDLWQMPMTIEWDWAEMTGFGMYNDPSGAAVLAGGDRLYDAVLNNNNAAAAGNMNGYVAPGNTQPDGTAT